MSEQAEVVIPGLNEKNVEVVDEETSDLILNSELIDRNSGGGTSNRAVNVETDIVIVTNPGGGDKSDQTYMIGPAYIDSSLEGGSVGRQASNPSPGAGGKAWLDPCLHVPRGRPLMATYWRVGLNWPAFLAQGRGRAANT